MRLPSSTVGLLAGGALLFAVPAAATASSSNHPIPTDKSACATRAQFDRVQNGQTVAQVQQEMGDVSSQNGGVAHHHGGKTYSPIWNKCGQVSLPGGVTGFSVDFSADSGQPFTVTGKSGL